MMPPNDTFENAAVSFRAMARALVLVRSRAVSMKGTMSGLRMAPVSASHTPGDGTSMWVVLLFS